MNSIGALETWSTKDSQTNVANSNYLRMIQFALQLAISTKKMTAKNGTNTDHGMHKSKEMNSPKTEMTQSAIPPLDVTPMKTDGLWETEASTSKEIHSPKTEMTQSAILE